MIHEYKREYFYENSREICQSGIPSEEYMSEIAEAYGHSYDDRDGIKDGPTLREMALLFKTSEVRHWYRVVRTFCEHFSGVVDKFILMRYDS